MINYQPLRPERDGIAATVSEKGFGLACGPKGNIKYISTFDVARSVAVGIIVKGETFPHIALGHIDEGTIVDLSIDAMLAGVGYNPENRPKVYIVSGDVQKRQTEPLLDLFPDHRFEVFVDFRVGDSRKLVFDLATGKPLQEDSCDRLHRYGVPEDVLETRTQSYDFGRKELILELDMRERIPTAGLAIHLVSNNPDRAPVLDPK